MDKTSLKSKAKREAGRSSKEIEMTPTETQSTNLKPEQKVFDLETMDEVVLFKDVEFSPVQSVEAGLAAVGNDTAKFLAIVNKGLESYVSENAIADPAIPWKQEDEEGVITDFTGTIADAKIVQNLILSMAKSVFGYAKDIAKNAKKAAKENAMTLIRSTPAIRDGLKSQAAPKA